MNKTTPFYIGLIALLLVAGFVYVYIDQKNVPNEEQKEMEGYSDFELAEYYFNADDDPEGPYDLKKARFYYEQTLNASSTEYDSAWYQLGRIDFLEGNFTDAIYRFEKQLEYFENRIPNVHYMIGLTYAYRAQETNSDQDWFLSEQAFKQAMGFAPTAPWPRVDLAWVYFSQGKFQEMIPVLQFGIEKSPENPWLHNMYGLALMNTGALNEAQSEFRLAKELAESLSQETWGKSYPGNDPKSWSRGLESFKEVLEKNLLLTQQ